MSATPLSVPFEKQFDLQSTRTCGAACLSMVYRSFGQEVPQRLIWPLIAKKNQYGSIASTTHLMAADATTRGLSAVAVQARYPLEVLRLCRESGIHAILNHRLSPDSPAGHYTVLVDIDATHVTLHDPYFGPSRRLTHSVLLDLWQPRIPNSEIVGNFLIGVASDPTPTAPCEVCHTKLPPSIPCPRCKNPVSLQPGVLLGCLNASCDARMWNYLCCPVCDLTWNFSVDAPLGSAPAASESAATPGGATPPRAPAAAASAAPVPPKNPLSLPNLFAELDKFCTYILAIPGAGNNADIMRQIEFISSSKEKLKKVAAETIAQQKARFDQVAAIKADVRKREEAQRKKMEELKKPLPPLDGDALARTLLKNLGFIS